jgi:hypothetical protein
VLMVRFMICTYNYKQTHPAKIVEAESLGTTTGNRIWTSRRWTARPTLPHMKAWPSKIIRDCLPRIELRSVHLREVEVGSLRSCSSFCSFFSPMQRMRAITVVWVLSHPEIAVISLCLDARIVEPLSLEQMRYRSGLTRTSQRAQWNPTHLLRPSDFLPA